MLQGANGIVIFFGKSLEFFDGVIKLFVVQSEPCISAGSFYVSNFLRKVKGGNTVG